MEFVHKGSRESCREESYSYNFNEWIFQTHHSQFYFCHAFDENNLLSTHATRPEELFAFLIIFAAYFAQGNTFSLVLYWRQRKHQVNSKQAMVERDLAVNQLRHCLRKTNCFTPSDSYLTVHSDEYMFCTHGEKQTKGAGKQNPTYHAVYVYCRRPQSKAKQMPAKNGNSWNWNKFPFDRLNGWPRFSFFTVVTKLPRSWPFFAAILLDESVLVTRHIRLCKTRQMCHVWSAHQEKEQDWGIPCKRQILAKIFWKQ